MGCPRYVPYEAPQGRRLNVIGGYFSHGPQRGEFQFACLASVPQPKPRANGRASKTLAEVAADHGLQEEDLGVVDSEMFLAFVWQLAGRPVDAPAGWRRERPLHVVVDNYSVHRSARVKAERQQLTAANVELVYLSAYSPELSRIEPQWKITKYHELTRRSHMRLGEAKADVETALALRAIELRSRVRESGH